MSAMLSSASLAMLAPAPVGQTDDARLRKTATQMEGLFIERMFAAMRDTVPTDGMFGASNAESTFTDLLDEKVSERAPAQWSGSHSIADALYHQLRQRLAESSGAATVSSDSTSGGTI